MSNLGVDNRSYVERMMNCMCMAAILYKVIPLLKDERVISLKHLICYSSVEPALIYMSCKV